VRNATCLGEMYWVSSNDSISRGVKRLRKKSAIQVKSPKSIPPGLKPTLILLALCGG
jgi:hypothetical protein